VHAGRQQMVLDDSNFQNVAMLQKDDDSGWTWISFSLLAKSVSFLVQQENYKVFLVDLDAPETNSSEVKVQKCSGLITTDEKCKIVLNEVI
jgi:hypothetical protein